MTRSLSVPFLLALSLSACGDDAASTPDAGPSCDTPPGPFATGDADGHADPLGAGPGEARAGRIGAADLPADPDGVLTWAGGDFVLANDRIALVIEDVGESDLYDPWGGKPVGIARVVDGALVDPSGFGEQFFMTGKATIATTAVTVLNDGSDGEAAVVRASGRLAPLPFLNGILGSLFFDDLTDIEAALDFVLEPGAEVIDVYFRYGSPRAGVADVGAIIHGFMYTRRMPAMVPGKGFTEQVGNATWVQLVDDDGASWGYRAPGEPFTSPIAQAGFIGAFTSPLQLPGCGVTDRHHAQIVIGGPGLDGLEQARARVEGRTLRAITGTVTDGVDPLPGARVHAMSDAGDYLTRVTTDAEGAFTLHVPADEPVSLTAYRRGWATGTAEVDASGTSAQITVPRSGAIRVVATDGAGELPVRVQVLPRAGTTIPPVPEEFGEPGVTGGRLHVEYDMDGDVTLPVPPGDWQVVVSRGYEYDLEEADVTVAAGATTEVDATLTRVVATPGIQCGDFHIHTHRSNDSGDDPLDKLRSAVADGVELPVRTEHEYVDSFADLIDGLGLQAWAAGIGSIEMTSFLVWGHMNVFPLDPDPTAPNQGAPRWAEWPTPDDPDRPVQVRSPPEVFEELRARPSAPTIIINHPRGTADYFEYVGLDRVTGIVDRTDDWDTEFTLVEVFNDSGWLSNRNGIVLDWFTLLNSGRPVFAVGSSDSHGITSSPVGYPRTCIDLDTDDPRDATGDLVRDRLATGQATVSGGVYVTASVGGVGPGGTATGTGAAATVDVTIQAAPWIDVDAIDVVVDGVTVDTIAIDPEDADPGNPAIRWSGPIAVNVATGGSWVVVAAYGDATLEPVHPGRVPFGVTNPIWMER